MPVKISNLAPMCIHNYNALLQQFC